MLLEETSNRIKCKKEKKLPTSNKERYMKFDTEVCKKNIEYFLELHAGTKK